MIRGTTPTHKFNIPVTEAEIKDVRVTYRQNNVNVLEKKKNDISFIDGKLTVDLSQEDTLKFTAGTPANVRLRILTTADKVLANKEPIIIKVIETYNEDILI